MRTSLSQQTQSALMYIDSASKKLISSQEVAVSGKRISRPSDDVPGTSRSMSLRTSISTLEQLKKNIEVCQPQLEASINAVNEMVQKVNSVKTIALEAANTDYTAGAKRDTLKAELEQILADLVDLANTKHTGKFVFSGTMTDQQPITLNTLSSTPPYNYNGNSETKTAKVLEWVNLPVNVPGDKLFNFDGSAGAGTTDIFTMIKQLETAMDTGNPSEISAQLDNIDANYNNLLSNEARMGSWSARMETASGSLADTKVRIQSMLSDNEDVDLTEAVVNLKTQENVFTMALQVTNRMLELSLASSNA